MRDKRLSVCFLWCCPTRSCTLFSERRWHVVFRPASARFVFFAISDGTVEETTTTTTTTVTTSTTIATDSSLDVTVNSTSVTTTEKMLVVNSGENGTEMDESMEQASAPPAIAEVDNANATSY